MGTPNLTSGLTYSTSTKAEYIHLASSLNKSCCLHTTQHHSVFCTPREYFYIGRFAVYAVMCVRVSMAWLVKCVKSGLVLMRQQLLGRLQTSTLERSSLHDSGTDSLKQLTQRAVFHQDETR